MKRTFLLFAIVLLRALPVLAEGTQTWKQSTFEEFEKGTAKGVAIRSDGALELAPAFQATYTSPSTYIWAIAADGEGDVYAAADLRVARRRLDDLYLHCEAVDLLIEKTRRIGHAFHQCRVGR